MAKLTNHWTEDSSKDFLYRIASDYVRQIDHAITVTGTTQAKLAASLGVSEGRVSQVLNNPGNLTLKKIIEYARALGKKVAIVMYDDGDSPNKQGPVNAAIFSSCWESAGKPTDFFELNDINLSAATSSNSLSKFNLTAQPWMHPYSKIEIPNARWTATQGQAYTADKQRIALHGGANADSLYT